jgi:hypothetical protein
LACEALEPLWAGLFGHQGAAFSVQKRAAVFVSHWSALDSNQRLPPCEDDPKNRNPLFFPCFCARATCKFTKESSVMQEIPDGETDDAVERALRHAVIWRRISGGTDSVEGSRFVERMLTVVATCRQQGRNVLDYLTECFEADRRGQALPSLLPVPAAEAKAA